MKQISLPICVSPSSDHGRSIVRIPSNILDTLEISPGDAVAISRDGRTHCRAIRGSSASESVEIDPQTAARIGADWGETALIEHVVLRPLSSAIIELLEGATGTTSDITEALYDLPLAIDDVFEVTLRGGKKVQIRVLEAEPENVGFFVDRTVLSIAGRPTKNPVYEGVGGLESQIARVHEMVSTPLQRPELYAKLGIKPPQGILFTGPPGTGKTLLARAVAASTSSAFFHINAPEIVSKHYGDSEAALRKLFDAAGKSTPAIVFIDELDAIAPRREALSGEKQVERRVVAQLLTLLDGLSDRGQIVVMAATNLPDSLDPALRRPGRFDREIVFHPPNKQERGEILGVHLGEAPLESDVDLYSLAERTHGYVGADLASLAREAAIAALSRTILAAGGEERVSSDDLKVSSSDLEHGLSVTRPAALRDTVIESPHVSWNDIGGHEDVKSKLRDAVLLPLKHRESFLALGVPPARGILLSGPPGSGKTLLARALASDSGLNFIGVRPTKILSQFLGEAERAVAELFAKARQAAPTLLFFDEFDALAKKRSQQDAVLDRVVAQLLVEMDGLTPNDDVIVLGATNRSAVLDPALIRAGRIDLIIPVPLPGPVERRAILEVHLKNRAQQALDLDSIVAETEGASGADLAGLVQFAAREALRRHLADRSVEPALINLDFDVAMAERAIRTAEQSTDYTRLKQGVLHET